MESGALDGQPKKCKKVMPLCSSTPLGKIQKAAIRKPKSLWPPEHLEQQPGQGFCGRFDYILYIARSVFFALERSRKNMRQVPTPRRLQSEL